MLSAVELGKEYIQTVLVGRKKVKVSTIFQKVNNVSVPYGTFDEVIKVTFKEPGETRLHYYAKGIGQIMQYKTSSDRTDELLDITDGHTSQPLD